MRRLTRKQWGGIAALIGILFLFSLLVPAYGEICHTDYDTHHKYCTSYHIALVLLWHIGELLNYYGIAVSAFFTGVIGYFTRTLWVNAKAELIHSHKVERAYISAGGGREIQWDVSHKVGTTVNAIIETRTRRDTGQFEFHVNNFGKTPGCIRAIAYKICEESAIAKTEPIYAGKYWNSWIDPGRISLCIDIDKIPTELKEPAAYGRVWFKTIFETWHSSGFVYRIRQGEGSKSISPPHPSYIEERDYKNEQEARTHAGLSDVR